MSGGGILYLEEEFYIWRRNYISGGGIIFLEEELYIWRRNYMSGGEILYLEEEFCISRRNSMDLFFINRVVESLQTAILFNKNKFVVPCCDVRCNSQQRCLFRLFCHLFCGVGVLMFGIMMFIAIPIYDVIHVV